MRRGGELKVASSNKDAGGGLQQLWRTQDAEPVLPSRPGGGPTPASRRRIPPKLYRIGELVEYSGVSRQTIHNYTTMGLIRESKWTDGGHRLYDESAFHRLDAIAELKSQNRSLEYIREYFARLDE
jgi:hypothetical protein